MKKHKTSGYIQGILKEIFGKTLKAKSRPELENYHGNSRNDHFKKWPLKLWRIGPSYHTEG